MGPHPFGCRTTTVAALAVHVLYKIFDVACVAHVLQDPVCSCFPRKENRKSIIMSHSRERTISIPHGVAVIRCLRITPAGECRWCMRDGPGWGQRAAEETFGIDQFFPFESYVDINANVQRRDSRRCGRDTFLGCDPDRHYNRASARVCYPGTTEAGRVGGRGDVRILCQTAAAIHRIRMQMHHSKPVRLLITLYGSRHLSVHDAHAPATRLRRPARVHELTIAAGSDSSSTFVRQDGGVAAPDAKRVLQCHPESVRLRRSPAARTPGNWLGSIACLATVLQSGIATQPAADGGRRQR